MPEPEPAPKRPAATPPPRNPKRKRLSFKETNELAALPDQIDALEGERGQLYLSLADPALLRDKAAVASARTRLAGLEVELAALTQRWEELETLAAEG